MYHTNPCRYIYVQAVVGLLPLFLVGILTLTLCMCARVYEYVWFVCKFLSTRSLCKQRVQVYKYVHARAHRRHVHECWAHFLCTSHVSYSDYLYFAFFLLLCFIHYLYVHRVSVFVFRALPFRLQLSHPSIHLENDAVSYPF